MRLPEIWKYQFDTRDKVSFNVPQGGKILAVQMQGKNPCIWIQVWPDNDKELRKFMVYGTGQPIFDSMYKNYVGTYQYPELGLVFHVYEDMRMENR